MSQATAASIVISEMRGRVKWVKFNRPEVKNAITPEASDLMREEIEQAEGQGARVVVLSGAGGAFCSGADLKALAPVMSQFKGVREILARHYHRLVMAIADSPLPVIAAVDGAAAGIGSDIALAADIRLASEHAFFAEIFVNINLVPDGGGTFTLPRLVGMGRALEMAFTGNRVPAEDAAAWGLVNHVYPAEAFEDKVQEFAAKLADKAPLAMARSKRLIRASLDGGSLADALIREADTQEELIGTHDFREGVMAFLEKRRPNYEGR